MTPSFAPLLNILLDNLKTHPELITRLFCQEEEVSVMFTKPGNQIAMVQELNQLRALSTPIICTPAEFMEV